MEYYYYKQPVVKNIFPHAGPIEGGTDIIVEGAWFKFIPEYGVIPQCKIGDSITKGIFESTVRIICPSPPGNSLNKLMPLAISQNGVDFINTDQTFHYYTNSNITGISPPSGPNIGGTTIRLFGNNFSDLSKPEEFKCRFRALHKMLPPKYINARFFNDTTILCASPGGWGDVDTVLVDATFNGVDYTPSQIYKFYNIISAHPRSGPADGTGGNVVVKGFGLKSDTSKAKCRFGDKVYDAVKAKQDEIECAIPAYPGDPNKFENVEFGVSVNGEEWHDFTGGFQYYKQPEVSKIDPQYGPNVGRGKVTFYGQDFRNDFQ